ncbi:MAG: hypothetical protein AAGE94_15570 [Acidobacteriota bacterium]
MRRFAIFCLCLGLLLSAGTTFAACNKCGVDSDGIDRCERTVNTWNPGWALCIAVVQCFPNPFTGNEFCFSRCKVSDPCPQVY